VESDIMSRCVNFVQVCRRRSQRAVVGGTHAPLGTGERVAWRGAAGRMHGAKALSSGRRLGSRALQIHGVILATLSGHSHSRERATTQVLFENILAASRPGQSSGPASLGTRDGDRRCGAELQGDGRWTVEEGKPPRAFPSTRRHAPSRQNKFSVQAISRPSAPMAWIFTT
jgi:hypothetical protein